MARRPRTDVEYITTANRTTVYAVFDNVRVLIDTFPDLPTARATMALWSADGARVYFLRDGRHVKIGRTTRSPIERLVSCQTGNPRLIRLVHVLDVPPEHLVRVERACHSYWRSRRSNGEWFKIDVQELKDFIEKEAQMIRRGEPVSPGVDVGKLEKDLSSETVEHDGEMPSFDDELFAEKYVAYLSKRGDESTSPPSALDEEIDDALNLDSLSGRKEPE